MTRPKTHELTDRRYAGDWLRGTIRPSHSAFLERRRIAAVTLVALSLGGSALIVALGVVAVVVGIGEGVVW